MIFYGKVFGNTKKQRQFHLCFIFIVYYLCFIEEFAWFHFKFNCSITWVCLFLCFKIFRNSKICWYWNGNHHYKFYIIITWTNTYSCTSFWCFTTNHRVFLISIIPHILWFESRRTIVHLFDFHGKSQSPLITCSNII